MNESANKMKNPPTPFEDSSLKSSLTWTTTGLFMNFIERTLKLNLATEGLDNLVPNPTLYVVNHFTRIETFILPYLLHTRANDAPRSLAHHSLFKGTFGRYISHLGAVSTREPLRNRLIISDLMTGRKNWVIYPEGVMVKNKKYIESGKYMLNVPSHKGPPRSGAAVLALRAAHCKSAYFEACAQSNIRFMQHLEKRYHFEGPGDLARSDIVLTPVNITYYPIRPSENLVSRMAHQLIDDIPDKIEEELKFEGNVLLGQTDMHVSFCPPIPIAALSRPKTLLQKTVRSLVPRHKRIAYQINKQRIPLTRRFMESIYTNVTINIDHLFCHGLRKRKAMRMPKDDFHKAIALTAFQLMKSKRGRLHDSLSRKCIRLAAGIDYKPLNQILQEVESEQIIEQQHNDYRIHQERFLDHVEYEKIRTVRTTRVISNEIEPHSQGVDIITRNFNLSSSALNKQLFRTLKHHEQSEFEEDYARFLDPEFSKAPGIGNPIFLDGVNQDHAILLVHGYTAAPMEMEPLAKRFQQHGIASYCIRLKGHGTSPKNLTKVTMEDWIDSVVTGYAMLKSRYRNVYAVGFSMGALLSSILAAKLKHRLSGLALINPALRIRERRAHLVGAALLVKEIFQNLNLKVSHLEYVENRPRNPEINYTRNYLLGVQQLARTCRECQRQLHEVQVPTLIIQSTKDQVVDPVSASIIQEQISSSQKELVELNTDSHHIVTDHHTDVVFRMVVEFFQPGFRS